MSNINVLKTDIRSTVRKEVPMISGAWVDFYDDIKAGQIEEAQRVQQGGDFSEALKFLLNQISDWNFGNEKEEKLPLSIDSLRLLPLKVITWMIKELTVALNTQEFEDKKKV